MGLVVPLTELVHAAGDKLKLSCKTQFVEAGVQEIVALPGGAGQS